MNHHLRRRSTDDVIERVKATFFHYWILMGCETTNCTPMRWRSTSPPVTIES